MSSSTKIYLDQNINGKDVKLPIILNSVMEGLNSIIKKSYDEYKIAEKEGSRIPFIRNKSLVRNFIYTPFVAEDMVFNTFKANFNIFVSAEEVGGFPQDDFKIKKPNTIIQNQSRHISMTTDMNYDAKDIIENITEKNNYIIISLGDDIVGQRIMKELAQHLHRSLNVEVYYRRTDLEDTVELIHINKSLCNEIKPNKSKIKQK